MHKIATLNKISPVGLARFTDKYSITEDLEAAEGVLVRSHSMLEMDFSANLLAIARAGAGTNNIPSAKCAERGIAVFNTPGSNANAVKELVIAAMFLAARNLPDAIAWAGTLTTGVAGEVEKGKGKFAGNELKGKTLGLIGLGAIGALVGNAAEKLGMSVIGYDPFLTVQAAHKLSDSIPMVSSLGELLPVCDYLSIHVPGMDSTKGMIGKDQFAQMKKGVCFLNFSRDTLVNQTDLFEAIDSGALGKYVTDFPVDALVGRKGVLCIPHLGASTEEAEDASAVMAADQVMDYIENGNMVNSVNYPNCSMGRFNSGAAKCRACVISKNAADMPAKVAGALGNAPVTASASASRGDYTYSMFDLGADVDCANLSKVDGVVAARVIR